MEGNLPATTAESSEATSAVAVVAPVPDAAEPTPPPRRQRLSVAFLPLALVTFVVLAIIIAAWTFLSAAG